MTNSKLPSGSENLSRKEKGVDLEIRMETPLVLAEGLLLEKVTGKCLFIKTGADAPLKCVSCMKAMLARRP